MDWKEVGVNINCAALKASIEITAVWASDYTADKKFKLMPPVMKARQRGRENPRKEQKQKVGHLLFVMLNVIQAKFDED